MIKNLEYKLIVGKNPTIVFLHGWGTSGECFKSIVDNLNTDNQILILDFFGFGKSDEPYDYFDTYEYSYSIFLLLKKLNIDEIVLIGHSFGGRISIILSSIFGLKIKGLILTSSAGINRFSLIKWVKIKWYKILKKLSSKIMFINNFLPSGSDDYKILSSLMKKIFIRIINQDLKYLLNKIKIKTLLVWDKYDNITPYYICRILNTFIYQSKIILFN